jgi:hypothetical protein
VQDVLVTHKVLACALREDRIVALISKLACDAPQCKLICTVARSAIPNRYGEDLFVGVHSRCPTSQSALAIYLLADAARLPRRHGDHRRVDVEQDSALRQSIRFGARWLRYPTQSIQAHVRSLEPELDCVSNAAVADRPIDAV